MYIQSYFTAKLSFNYVSELRNKLYKLILEQSYSDNKNKDSSSLIINLTDDTEKIKEMIFSVVSELMPGAIMVICTLLYAFWINFYLSLLILVLVPLISFIINFFTQIIKVKSEQTQLSIAEVYAILNENFFNFMMIKVKNLENFKLNEYKYLEKKYKDNGLSVINYISLQPSVINIIQVTGICIIASFGAYQVFTDKITMAQLLSFGTALSLTIEPAIFITKSLGIVEKSKISLNNIKSTFKELENTRQKYGDKLIEDYSIDFENISFKYNQNNFEINNLNLKIKKGEVIAITGNNGSGKSTVTKILLRLIDDYNEKVKIGNNDLKEHSKSELRKNISASFHEPFLFNCSIKENILMGLNQYSNNSELLENVCQISKINEFIDSLDQGLNYIVGEKGDNLSSGQKQRISIARAIINHPRILILDEATSALDLESEKYIYQQIKIFLPESTIIIINHRKESIDFVDRKIFFESGTIIQ